MTGRPVTIDPSLFWERRTEQVSSEQQTNLLALEDVLGQELQVDGPDVEEDAAELEGARQVLHRVRHQERQPHQQLTPDFCPRFDN